MTNESEVTFKPVDLPLHTSTCIAFRADSFVVSFGDASKFHEADGQGSQRYIDWLKGKLTKDPNSVIHAWQNGKIIGQIEMGVFPEKPNAGFVNLYYLVPEKRGHGLGSVLDNYAMSVFKAKGFTSARLRVSPSNVSAIRFYEKMNWINLGPSQKSPELNVMEKIF